MNSNTAKAVVTSKSRKSRRTSNAPLNLARKLAKQYGPCTVIREVTQKFPKLARSDVLEVAVAVGINKGTASRQYQEIRSGNLTIVG